MTIVTSPDASCSALPIEHVSADNWLTAVTGGYGEPAPRRAARTAPLPPHRRSPPGGPARPSGRPVLGQARPRCVVDPQGRVRRATRIRSRRRGESSRRSSAARRPTASRSTWGRSGRRRARSCGRGRLPATSTRRPCTSNTFTMEWPPRSGRAQEFPRSTGPNGSPWPRPASGSTRPRCPAERLERGWREREPRRQHQPHGALHRRGVGAPASRTLARHPRGPAHGRRAASADDRPAAHSAARRSRPTCSPAIAPSTRSSNEAVEREAVTQVIEIAAGMSARGWRFSQPLRRRPHLRRGRPARHGRAQTERPGADRAHSASTTASSRSTRCVTGARPASPS